MYPLCSLSAGNSLNYFLSFLLFSSFQIISLSVAKSGPIQSRDQEKWINIDVLTSVYKWKSSTRRRDNYGFMIKLANEDQALSLLRFASNAHANTSIHAKLHVCLIVNIW